MTTEQKIEAIQSAINRADQMQSNMPPSALEVPFLGSLKIRALLNNLGALATHIADVGSHKGGSMCSMLAGNGNIKSATAIDSWASDETNEDKAYPQFIANANRFKSENTELNVIVGDCWEVSLDLIPNKIDLYSYDAGHSREDQKQALIYYKGMLADEFIYCCDDWEYGDVKEGTMEGIVEGGYEILFQQELLNPPGTIENDHLNEHWWRSYYVALLKKK
jgi:methyltransferase family protein